VAAENPKLRIAVIDLGSNTARLVLLSAVPGSSFRQIDEIREVVRLRKGMTEDGLAENAVNRAFSTLSLFKRFCDSRGVDEILAVATSAVRDAANGKAFIASVARDLGLSIELLSGEREAYYGALGVLNEVPVEDGYVLDIGGGARRSVKFASGGM
jgi:exopolyphosphatase/guanosine-5'-triphosphate,3'-diphosphate pyrophosphatase